MAEPRHNEYQLEAGQHPQSTLIEEKNTEVYGSPQALPSTLTLQEGHRKRKMSTLRWMLLLFGTCFWGLYYAADAAVLPRPMPCRTDVEGVVMSETETVANKEANGGSLWQAASPETLHQLLHEHLPDRFQHGIFSSDHEAFEALQSDKAAPDNAAKSLAKRQDEPNNLTTPATTSPSVTSPVTTESDPSTDDDTTTSSTSMDDSTTSTSTVPTTSSTSTESTTSVLTTSTTSTSTEPSSSTTTTASLTSSSSTSTFPVKTTTTSSQSSSSSGTSSSVISAPATASSSSIIAFTSTSTSTPSSITISTSTSTIPTSTSASTSAPPATSRSSSFHITTRPSKTSSVSSQSHDDEPMSTTSEAHRTTVDLRTTSSPVEHTYTHTLPNGGTTYLTSTSWVGVEASAAPSDTSSDPELQNGASALYASGGLLMVGVVGPVLAFLA